MNKVTLIGRMARDPEIKMNETSTMARFSIAVDRPAKKGEQRQADFIICLAWGRTSELIGNYFHKGSPIAIEGTIRTGSYTNKQGQKVYTTDVWVNNVEFLPRSKDDAQNQQPQQGFNANAFGGQQVSGDVEIDF